MPAQKPYKKLHTVALVAVIFFTVSGGPYGLEPLLSYCSGPQALLLLLVVPLLWDVPIILTVLELNSMMPATGGYYQWIKRALGLKWAFYEGWWSWLSTFIDLAIYPQLFVTYASLFFPQLAVYKIPVYIGLVSVCAYLNITGIIRVGRTSVFFILLVIVPFLLLFLLSGNYYHIAGVTALTHARGSLGLAVFTIVWNYIGWDNVTTYAGEVNKPVSSYIKAIISAFTLIFLVYIVVTIIAINSGLQPGALKDAGFPALGQLVGGRWLAMAIAIGGMVSSLGIFLSVLLSISRVPEAMAIDKLLPAGLCKMHPRYNTPYVSILVCAIIVCLLVTITFDKLVIMDISMYFLGMLLEFISLITLRVKEPGTERPFRIPLGKWGAGVMLTAPVAVYLFASVDALRHADSAVATFALVIMMVFSAEIAWRFARRRLPWQADDHPYNIKKTK